jgi:hypothetical protein
VVEGDISNDVYVIQLLIDETGRCSAIHTDGNFGQQTFNTVECFQRYNHLTVDGKVGQQTWEALQDLLKDETTDSGWNYWSGNGGLSHEFRKWASSGVWYVDEESNTTFQLKWCQMNFSAPCNP